LIINLSDHGQFTGMDKDPFTKNGANGAVLVQEGTRAEFLFSFSSLFSSKAVVSLTEDSFIRTFFPPPSADKMKTNVPNNY